MDMDQRLDSVYCNIDALLRASKFKQLDEIIGRVNVSRTEIDILLGLLTATFPAKSKLPMRAVLFKLVKAELIRRKEQTEALLQGLE